MQEGMSVTVRAEPKLGTTYTVYSVCYDGEVIHTQISAPSEQDIDDAVTNHLFPPTPRELPKRRQIASKKTLDASGSKQQGAAAFRRMRSAPVPSFYVEDDEE